MPIDLAAHLASGLLLAVPGRCQALSLWVTCNPMVLVPTHAVESRLLGGILKVLAVMAAEADPEMLLDLAVADLALIPRATVVEAEASLTLAKDLQVDRVDRVAQVDAARSSLL